ncbi:flagellar motor switch protein FliG [Acidovorax soli]|jgi:flagellar motor switch protein FliG|uniref:Flagellar motor switch protein FliG n=1 Tax=Acidovorax soli TaxID=592050 RepID=A0A7X0PJ67_9BURK|nr:flagellar motor switch protein FliG [Acidovorax soli]MBB6562552.1 flagellar motor switch protein FliG [Acidovorax soli]
MATRIDPPIAAQGDATSGPLEQAAIVLLCMGEEPAAAVLRCLSREELLEVTQVMSRLSGIKVETVRSSMQRFFDDYREQSGVHGASRSYLKRSLDLALGADIAGNVLNSIYGDAIRPKMARLQWASPKWLAERIGQEHVRMQAVFLAFLPPPQASAVIEALPEASRDHVLLNMARLQEIESEWLIELEEIVGRCLDDLGTQSATVEGSRQVAEIINRLSGDKRSMIELLRAHDPEVVSAIEVRMYDFFMLSNQTEAVLIRLLDDIPLEQWAIALKGAEPSVRDAILRAMPRRQAQSFEDLLRRAGPMPLSRVEQTRREIMAQVKALADAGEIQIQLFAEATVE